MLENVPISVLMSVHNGERYLRKSVESILNQTFRDFEFLIIDDGSSDSTPEILREYAASDERIRIVTNQNSLRLAAALNRGLELAHGKYIARHDDDDMALPHRLKLQYEYMESHPEIFLCGGQGIRMDADGTPGQILFREIDEAKLRRKLESGKNNIIHPSILFRNDGRTRYREKFTNTQDFDLYMLLYSRGERIVNLPHILLYFRQNGQQKELFKKAVRQRLFDQLVLRFYRERQETGRDTYETAEFPNVDKLDPATCTDPEILRILLKFYLASDDLKSARECLAKLARSKVPVSLRQRILCRMPGGIFKFLHHFSTALQGQRIWLPRIGLLATTGNGISDWDKVGSTNRELTMYQKLGERGWHTLFFHYDRGGEYQSGSVEGRSLPKKLKLPTRLKFLFGWMMPFLHWREGHECSILITNQAHGGWPAIWMGRWWKLPVIARCGYIAARGEILAGSPEAEIRRTARRERFTFSHADHCLLPTVELMEWANEHYKLPKDKMTLAPNFINGEIFRSGSAVRDIDILCVGRISYAKHYELLLDAVKGKGWKVVLIGGGDAAPLLKAAEEMHLDLEIIPRVPNEKLPEYLNRAKVYVMCSRWEGHPKALIEAMACGCACVVCNAPGVTRQVEHDRTAWLTSATPEALSTGIEHVLNDPALADRLRHGAEEYAQRVFALEHLVNIYESTLIKVLFRRQEQAK